VKGAMKANGTHNFCRFYYCCVEEGYIKPNQKCSVVKSSSCELYQKFQKQIKDKAMRKFV
jgi:hypothetical protein